MTMATGRSGTRRCRNCSSTSSRRWTATRPLRDGRAGGAWKGPEYLAWLAEAPEADYTVLMGATTYRVMSAFAAAGEPGTEPLAGMSKVVFSTTLHEPLVRRRGFDFGGCRVSNRRSCFTDG